jgi:hypothetical protein
MGEGQVCADTLCSLNTAEKQEKDRMTDREYYVITREGYGVLVNNPLHAGMARWGSVLEDAYVFSSRERAENLKVMWGCKQDQIHVKRVSITIEEMP